MINIQRFRNEQRPFQPLNGFLASGDNILPIDILPGSAAGRYEDGFSL
jgi:hypothetical protein